MIYVSHPFGMDSFIYQIALFICMFLASDFPRLPGFQIRLGGDSISYPLFPSLSPFPVFSSWVLLECTTSTWPNHSAPYCAATWSHQKYVLIASAISWVCNRIKSRLWSRVEIFSRDSRGHWKTNRSSNDLSCMGCLYLVPIILHLPNGLRNGLRSLTYKRIICPTSHELQNLKQNWRETPTLISEDHGISFQPQAT